jgi:plastocyanin
VLKHKKEELRMKKKGNVSLVVGLWFVFVMTMFHIGLDTTSAQECRILRIHGGVLADTLGKVSKIELEPQTVWISKGTCLVWINWVRGYEVKVVFEDAKKCEDTTDAAVGFEEDVDNCYVTTWMRQGETSSLRFTAEGAYEYVVEAKGGVKAKGKIVVR